MIGRNFAIGDRFVLGLEVMPGVYFSGGTAYFEIYGFARAGFLLTENLMLYATFGGGRDFASTPPDYLIAGGGAELALGNRFSLRTDVQYFRNIGTAIAYLSVTGGISLYLGR